MSIPFSLTPLITFINSVNDHNHLGILALTTLGVPSPLMEQDLVQ
jgi:hypothetical protein